MLHRHWPEPRPEWHVAALRLTKGAEAAWSGVTFHEFKPDAESLARMLDEAGCEMVALHYVPHGYQPRGIPGWLPDGLAHWKAKSGGRLITFFHELFAVSPPWRTAFWLAPSSVSILRKVASLSDIALTSNDLYARQIQTFGGQRTAVPVVPIGTNVSAYTQAALPSAGPWRVAVFGTAKTRFLALCQHERLLRELSTAELLETLVLIGASGGSEDIILARSLAPTECAYDLAEDKASRILASTSYGLVATDEARVFKSGVFAAYCAHGVLPLLEGTATEAPYLASTPGAISRTIERMRDAELQTDLKARVESHARRSSWPTITDAWSKVLEI